MRIDSSGNVGIGTAAPVGKVEVFGSSGGGAGTVVPVSITVGDTSTGNAWPGDGTLSTVFNYYSGDGTNQGVRFRHGVGETATSGSTSAWKIQYRAAGGAINSYSGFSDALIVDTGGSVRIDNYVSIGGAAASTTGLKVVSAALTGTSQDGIQSAPVATSAATAQIRAFTAIPGTAAAAFTCAAAYGFRAYDASTGAGSTITSLYGVYVNDLTQGTNNYGITSIVTSGTNKFNIYASGTADNYFAGDVGIGTSAPSRKLHVVGSNAVALLADSGTDNTIAIFQSSNAQANLDVTGSGARFRIGASGTGEFFLSTGTTSTYTERLRIDSTGNVGIGTSSPGAKLDVVGNMLLSASNPLLRFNTGGPQIYVTTSNTLQFSMNGGTNEAMRIDSSGNVLVTTAAGLGYGTGSGGTVTQATSKSTAVTLNKPSGRITMNGAALAASTTVEFTFNNSLIAGGDMVVFNITGNAATAAAYNIGTRGLAAGSVVVGIRNVTAGSLSESIQLTFALIKGATA
jgi:hypothetical protein